MVIPRRRRRLLFNKPDPPFKGIKASKKNPARIEIPVYVQNPSEFKSVGGTQFPGDMTKEDAVLSILQIIPSFLAVTSQFLVLFVRYILAIFCEI